MENATPREHTEDFARARAHMEPDVKEILKGIEEYLEKAKAKFHLAENSLYRNPKELMRDLLIERLQELG